MHAIAWIYRRLFRVTRPQRANQVLLICEVLFVWFRGRRMRTGWLTHRIRNGVLTSTDLVLQY
eukprot:COSAG02_NODE_579_length_20073_cov_2118.572745_10_plen_63_part_00